MTIEAPAPSTTPFALRIASSERLLGARLAAPTATDETALRCLRGGDDVPADLSLWVRRCAATDRRDLLALASHMAATADVYRALRRREEGDAPKTSVARVEEGVVRLTEALEPAVRASEAFRSRWRGLAYDLPGVMALCEVVDVLIGQATGTEDDREAPAGLSGRMGRLVARQGADALRSAADGVFGLLEYRMAMGLPIGDPATLERVRALFAEAAAHQRDPENADADDPTDMERWYALVDAKARAAADVVTRALTPDTGEEAAVLAALAGARARLGAMAKGPQRGKPVTADAVETLLWACCALAERWQPRRAGHKTGDIGAAQDLTLGSKSVVVDLAQALVGFADMIDAAEGREIDGNKVPSFAQAGPEMVKEWRAVGGRPLFGAPRA